MRRLATAQLGSTIALPQSAQLLAVEIGCLVYSFDDADKRPVTRQFIECHDGDQVPAGARFLGTYRLEHCLPSAVFELVEALPDDIPAEAHGHYRRLVDDGFELRADKAWLAPADIEPGRLTTEQIIAVATLQEHGYGPVVGEP